jgi:hypothetical protein
LGLSVAVLLVFCSIFLHKPTFGKTVKLIGKLPMTNQLVESLESARENVDSQENPTLDTDSLVGLIVAPFILMGYAIYFSLIVAFYAIYFSLIVAFYAIMLYLAVSAAFLILIGSAAFMCFLLPFFLLLSLFG